MTLPTNGRKVRTVIKRIVIAVLLLSPAPPALAQQPVEKLPDYASWGTALVNPSVAAVQALRSDRPGCRLAQLAISEAVGNAATIAIKHFVVSPRPCLGCAADGSPSGHSMNATIGLSQWRYGLVLSFGTMQLRRDAHRHTLAQVLQGFAVGIGAEAAGRLVKCEP